MNIPSWRTREFVDPAHGDYRVKDGSPALALGFVNFPMDQFGVQKPELKAIARVPQLPQPKMPAPPSATRDAAPVTWLGASVRNIADEGEMSAFGLPGVTGVLVLERSGGVGPGQSRAAEKTMSFFPSTAGRRRTRRRCCGRLRDCPPGIP